MTTVTLAPRVISLKELYQQHLSIPYYQRPYKLIEKHVRVLFDDLDYFVAGITAKTRDDKRYKYRLGTIVLHKGHAEAKDYLAKFLVETSDEIAIDTVPIHKISVVAAVDAAATEALENETRSASKYQKDEVAVEQLATEDTTSDTGSSENY